MSRRKPGRPPAEPIPAAVLAARARAEVLVDAAQIETAIDRLAVAVSLALGEANPLLLAVMNGALPFAGALLPRLGFPLEVGYLHVGRYGDATRGGDLHWYAEPQFDVRDRTVLLIDDVLDHGTTLAELVSWCRAGGARQVLSAVLVDKQVDAARPVAADFVAVSCPDRYLFGYGMDYRGYWRNLPAIHALPADLEGES